MENTYELPENFINRELSWIEFNRRVLEEAEDPENPLFERLKFSAIVSSNLDEFFMIRVASLWELVDAEISSEDPSGLTPREQLRKISVNVHGQVAVHYKNYTNSLIRNLEKENIYFVTEKQLNESQCKFVYDFYMNQVYPVLTPMVVDQSRHFPLLLNKSLNIALLLQNKKDETEVLFGTIQVPSVLDRFVELPSEDGCRCFILLEDIIRIYLEDLFNGHHILKSSCYRITRNADLSLDEDEAEDLLLLIEQSIKQRKWGAAVRLEIESGDNEELISILAEELDLSKDEEYVIDGPIDLTFLMKLSGFRGCNDLKFPKMKPQSPAELTENNNIFETLSRRDFILHHPYNSFEPIIQLIQKAADDADVLAIKQTLYRVSGNSQIVESLARAAENGKQVTVLVELKARFDEENNIIWAKRLEKAGCHVIYGIVGLKTHCKLLLIVRREADGIRRYVHLGTGNYNDVTARLYTDLGLLTSKPQFGSDASALFNMMTGHSEPKDMHKLTYAPVGLREKFLYLIDRETENAREGQKGLIIIKVNSLVDKEIIKALYKASSAGVDIMLIVRGICCLRPELPSVSERITVRSIVGRFLEHSRIFYFFNHGKEEIYLGSADLMNRNLDRRVELIFPIDDKEIKNKIKEILDVYLKDNVKARILNSDGHYTKVEKTDNPCINSQEYFL